MTRQPRLTVVAVCPSLERYGASDIDESESDVYEDPAILYEDAIENPDPIDLDNHLVKPSLVHVARTVWQPRYPLLF